MHRWDSRRRPPPSAVTPVRWTDAPYHLSRGSRAPGLAGQPGLPSQGQLRGPGWKRTSRGLYVPTGAGASPEQRITEAAALLPAYGAVGGWASAYLLGARLLDGRGPYGCGTLPVLLCLGADGQIRPRPGVATSRDRLPVSDVWDVDGHSCTSPLRSAFDCARLMTDLTEAVVHVDLILACDFFPREELSAYVAAHPGWRGVPRARRVVALAAAGVRSPPETRMRLAWVLDAGLPAPLVNRPVFDLTGNLLGYPDLLDPEAGTVSEYDSDDHRELSAHTADNVREECFEHHGLTVARVTKLDLRASRRPALVSRLRQARARGLRRDRSHDRWTLQPVPGWRGPLQL